MQPRPFRAALVCVLTLSLSASATSQPATAWPEAIASLAAGQTLAEACVSLLKRYGTLPQVANGELTYAKAKAESDAVIEGLVTALDTRATPSDLPSLQSKLTSSLSALGQFCDSVKAILPATPPSGEKGGLLDALSIIKEPISAIVTGALNGIAALYNNHRSDDLLTRKSIQNELRSARWPSFSSVKTQ
jgi:hypothetical protein